MARPKDIEERMIRKVEKNHPLKNMVYVIIAGITVLFLSMMIFFAMSNPRHFLQGHHFPKPFLLSTAIIVFCSVTIEGARRAFDREEGQKLLNNLMYTMGFAVAFAVSQAFGWKELWENKVTLYNVGDNAVKTSSGAFLFVISGLHLLHLGGGLIFLFLSMFKVVNMRSDDVRSVIYFSDRLERTRMEMLAKYWHYLGALWFLLFLYFLWFFI